MRTGEEPGGNKDHEKNDATDDEPRETGSLCHQLNCSMLRVIVVVAGIGCMMIKKNLHNFFLFFCDDIFFHWPG